MIRGIVFDKDGTLLDYERFWLPVAEAAIRVLTGDAGDAFLSAALLDSIGARDGIRGVLCYGTYGMIAERMSEVLRSVGRDAVTAGETSAAFEACIGHGEIVAACADIGGLFRELRRRGLYLGVVTSDNAALTGVCLDALGLADAFDMILCDDGVTPPKPAPDHMLAFCRRFGLTPDEVIMVGDTRTDLLFARNSGAFGVGVAADEDARVTLTCEGGVVLPDISLLPAYLDDLNGLI